MESPLSKNRICVTGGAGFLGRAVCSALAQRGSGEVFVPRSRDFDLTQPDAVARLFDEARPEVVIHHWDQGCQYTSIQFWLCCKEAGVES